MLSEPGCLPVLEVRECHFYLLLILDNTRPIILAVITKQNVNSLLEREREVNGEEREQEGRRKKRGKEEAMHRNYNTDFHSQIQLTCLQVKT